MPKRPKHAKRRVNLKAIRGSCLTETPTRFSCVVVCPQIDLERLEHCFHEKKETALR